MLFYFSQNLFLLYFIKEWVCNRWRWEDELILYHTWLEKALRGAGVKRLQFLFSLSIPVPSWVLSFLVYEMRWRGSRWMAEESCSADIS